MSIAPDSNEKEVPTSAAVSRFTVERLGAMPMLTVTIADTVEDTLVGEVVAMLAHPESTEELPLYRGIDVLFPEILDDSMTDLEVRRVSDNALVGTIYNSTVRLVYFHEPTMLDLTGDTVSIQRKNAFGVLALRKAKDSTERTLMLRTNIPDQFMRMATVMITAHIRAVLAALPGLGVEATLQQVQLAVLGASDNLESILASEFEQLELERRTHTFVGTVREG